MYIYAKQKHPRCKKSEAKSEAPLFMHATKKSDICWRTAQLGLGLHQISDFLVACMNKGASDLASLFCTLGVFV